MSALSVNDPGDPRSHHYYAPRQRRVVAREATLQPVLERLRGSTRDYSADERLGGNADPVALPEPEFVIVPDRRVPFAALAAFAGGATAVAAVAIAYILFGTNGAALEAAAAPAAPPAAHAPAAPAKIEARVAPNQPLTQPQPLASQVASADAAAAVPVDTSKGDRLDASANPTVGASYNPLQSPLSLWGMSPTQAAIEGTDPTLAAPGAPPAAPLVPEVAATPPHQAPPARHAEHHRAPVRHQSHRHYPVHHARHWRHHKAATTGEAVSKATTQDPGATAAGGGAGGAGATKKFLGIFGG